MNALSLNDVREAYFAAKKKLPSFICPEKFANEYQNGSVSKEVVVECEKLGYDFGSECKNENGEIEYFHTEAMAEYVVWYINQGNSDCDVKLEPKINDMLSFYGFDEHKRHIGFIGYGLFGD